jgi:hypothetical protein
VFALIFLLLNLLISLLKPTRRLKAENVALRQRLVVLQRKLRGRIEFTNGLQSVVSVVFIGPKGHDDRSALYNSALASGGLSPLLALEIAGAGRAAGDRRGVVRSIPANEP